MHRMGDERMREGMITRQSGGNVEPGLIDFGRLIGLVRRYWWLIAAITAATLIATWLAYQAAEPVYSATARVALERRQEVFVQTNADAPLLKTDSSAVDTEVQVIQSPELAGRVVDALQLAQVPEFGGEVGTPDIRRRRAIGILRGGLEVRRDGTSYAIAVSFESGSAELAARVVNAVVDGYVGSQLTVKSGDRQRETDLLGPRIAQLRGQLIAAEQAVAQYRAANNLLQVDRDGTYAAQEIAALNTQLADARAQQAAAQARLSAARGRGTDALGSTVVSALRAQQAEVSAERADLASRYGPRHPDLARIDQRLADINGKIRGEIGRVVASVEAEARVASGRTSSLQSSVNRAQGELMSENNAGVRLAELERNAASSRSLYQAFLDRYRGTVAAQGTERSDAQVIAHALVPGAPISPNRMVYLLLGLIGSVAASALAILVLSMLERGVTASDEVEDKLGVLGIGSVPDIRTIPGIGVVRRDGVIPADFMVDNPGGVFAESFRSIRAALQRGPGGAAVKVVAVTSALPGEGKTTIAICLARSAALAGQRAILVDCDLRQRASSRQAAGTVEHGLVEVLTGAVTLDQAIIQDSATGMYMLPQKLDGGDHFDLMSSPMMERFIAALRQEFDLIILDSAPVIPVAEARLVAAMADRVLFVMRWRKTPVRAAERALVQLDRVGATVVGAVLSLVNLKEQARLHQGDGAYYNQTKAYYTSPQRA